jgi:hypothetical protein
MNKHMGSFAISKAWEHFFVRQCMKAEAAGLASAICSKHNQGRRISSTYIASEPIIEPCCSPHAVDGRAMCPSTCTAASRNKQIGLRA